MMFLAPTVAIVKTFTSVSGFAQSVMPPGIQLDAEGKFNSHLMQVRVKVAKGWKIVAYHNTEVKPGMITAGR